MPYLLNDTVIPCSKAQTHNKHINTMHCLEKKNRNTEILSNVSCSELIPFQPKPEWGVKMFAWFQVPGRDNSPRNPG